MFRPRILSWCLLFSLVASLTLSSCGSSKKTTAGRKEIEEPFSSDKYMSDSKTFRATASGRSKNLEMAKEMAEAQARQNLASEMETRIRSVFDQYRQQRDIGQNSEFSQKTEDLTRSVVDQTLQGSRVMERKNFQEKDGSYTAYVAMEMPSENVVSMLNDRISKDQELRQDYDKAQFEETFNEEMEQLRKERGY
jgi:hypothetical protein